MCSRLGRARVWALGQGGASRRCQRPKRSGAATAQATTLSTTTGASRTRRTGDELVFCSGDASSRALPNSVSLLGRMRWARASYSRPDSRRLPFSSRALHHVQRFDRALAPVLSEVRKMRCSWLRTMRTLRRVAMGSCLIMPCGLRRGPPSRSRRRWHCSMSTSLASRGWAVEVRSYNAGGAPWAEVRNV